LSCVFTDIFLGVHAAIFKIAADGFGKLLQMNPLHSLANNVVPAVVLFPMFIGVALVGVERKAALLNVFSVTKEALAKATKFGTNFGVFRFQALKN
jgi:Na+/H+-dicarboxylate symporter